MTNKPLANPLGLSPTAKKRRQGFLTASDASRVMSGDWLGLWAEKKGLIAEESLDGVLRVQHGSFVEPFGLYWCEKQTGRAVTYHSDNLVNQKSWAMLTGRDAKSEWQVSVEHLYMGCSLDAMSTTLGGMDCCLDHKCTGQFREAEFVERYTPAMTHQCVVMDVDHWALSVLVNGSRWEYIEQAVDPFYAEELIEREAAWWDYYQRDVEPPDMRPEAAPKPTPRLRSIDMSMEFGTPEWQAFVAEHNWAAPMANEIARFAETEAAHKAHGVARTEIGKLVPDDVGKLIRSTKQGTFKLSRATNNALTMKIER